jgi:hypothetical protein
MQKGKCHSPLASRNTQAPQRWETMLGQKKEVTKEAEQSGDILDEGI